MQLSSRKIPGYALASTFVALGGILNGFDTGSVGAITEMPSYIGTFGHLSPTMRGFTVSLIMLCGAIPATIAGYLADRFGRLRIMIAGAVLCTIGCILECAAFHLWLFLVGRALMGIGQGFALTNIGVYICEIAPSRSRGKFVSLPQFGAAIGVCVGYFSCYGSIHIKGDMSWRLPYILQAALAVLWATGSFFLPESPRWLILHGRRSQAMEELKKLDFGTAEAEKDVLRPVETAAAEDQIGVLSGLRLIFTKDYRSQTWLAVFILSSIQLSGIDGVLYYAPTIFAQAGIPSQTASFLASGVSAILMLTFSIPATLLADKWGRRTSAICGGVILSASMLLIGSLYAADAVHSYGAARWVVIVSVFVFALGYVSTWAIVDKIYASEIQPTKTRATTNSMATGGSFLANWLVAFATPVFLARSAYGAYFLFGGVALLTLLVLAICMRETRGLSLEDIQISFARSSARVSYISLAWTRRRGFEG
ncbi:general substrate transporter [Alternaria alternata]|nr:general substrate transporter [Alternaria alternata]